MNIGNEVIIWSNDGGHFAKCGIIRDIDDGCVMVQHHDDATRHWYNTEHVEEINDRIIRTPCIKAKLPWK